MGKRQYGLPARAGLLTLVAFCLWVAADMAWAQAPPITGSVAITGPILLNAPPPTPKPPAINTKGAQAIESGTRPYTLDARSCQLLQAHVPTVDVVAGPANDPFGRQVTGADLQGASEWAKDLPVSMAVDVDLARQTGLTPEALAQRYGLPTNQGVSLRDVTAGIVTIAGGRVFVNGKMVDPDTERQLYILCRERR